MEKRGEITVFLAMILVSVLALLCVTVESVRTAGARCYLRMALDSSMDSLMSQYHKRLWERYRILGLEYDSEAMLEYELGQFLVPYQKAKNWYPFSLKEARARKIWQLSKGEGRYLEQEILDYMAYGLAKTVWNSLTEGEAEGLVSSLKEAGQVSRVSKLYEGHTKEAVRLERALEKLDECLRKQEESWEAGRRALGRLDGSDFIREAKRMEKELERVPGLVEKYEKRTDQLAAALEKSRSEFEAQGELSEAVRAVLEEEIRQYESYAAADGERRQEIAALRERSAENLAFIEETIREAEKVMEYIDAWEPDDEEDELDEEALWSPVRSRWERYPVLSLGLEHGVKDKEKEGFLERVRELAGEGLLGLVLPEGAKVSDQKLALPAGGGEKRKLGGDGADGMPEALDVSGADGFLDRLIVCEYMIRYFPGFEREMGEDDLCELEYLLCGRSRDRENLSGAAARLTALRQGLNLIYLFSDVAKRQEARGLALAIVGGTGLPPLVTVMTFFILSVWALGEAVMDVRRLLNGERVPFVKTEGDWRVSLEGLLEIGKNRTLTGLEDGPQSGRSGLDYRGYLRILLFGAYGRENVGRMMDLMELNLAKEQPGFSLDCCACFVEMETAFGGKHIFFSPVLWKTGDGIAYETRLEASGSYLE